MKLEVLDVCVKLNLSGGAAKSTPQHQHLNHHPSAVFMSNGISTHIPNGLRNGYGGSVTTTSNSMSRTALPAPPLPQILHPTMDDIRPSFSDLKQSFLGDRRSPYMEDIKPFAHPLSLAMIPTSHHSPPHRHNSPPRHLHSTPQPHHQLDIQIKQEDYSTNMEIEPSPPLLCDSGPKKTKSKGKGKKKESNNNCSSPLGSNPGEPKGRRPMNAFLVYAKEKRPLLIQMYPGKDNR